MDYHVNLAHSLLNYANFGTASPLMRKDAFQQKSLTPQSFQQAIRDSSQRTQMMWFFADWCGHCHKMKDAWEVAHQRGSQHDWHVVDCSSGSPLSPHVDVNSFPAVKRIKNGEIQDFNGERTPDSLIQFACS